MSETVRIIAMIDDRFVADLPKAERPNINKSRWDQSTYTGRAMHFFTVTNPLNLLASSAQLEDAKNIVTQYRSGNTDPRWTVEDIWKAKNLFDSAYHPDTNEKNVIIGRMSAQVPMNMLITGGMMTFYKTTPAVLFWQWSNQTFNATVNYCNRSGKDPINLSTLGGAYVGATTGAIVTSMGLNKIATKMPPLIGRFVPFVAVAAANSINIPMMRQTELRNGITLLDEHDNDIGKSPKTAKRAIGQVIFSRIGMAAPGMLLTPFIMDWLDKKPSCVRACKKMPWVPLVFQTILVGVILIGATPLCCALFPQKSSIAVSKLEPEIQHQLKQREYKADLVYYNKGL